MQSSPSVFATAAWRFIQSTEWLSGRRRSFVPGRRVGGQRRQQQVPGVVLRRRGGCGGGRRRRGGGRINRGLFDVVRRVPVALDAFDSGAQEELRPLHFTNVIGDVQIIIALARDFAFDHAAVLEMNGVGRGGQRRRQADQKSEREECKAFHEFRSCGVRAAFSGC